MTGLARLPVSESVQIDTYRLSALIRDLGEDGARDMLNLSLKQLSSGLTNLSQAVARDDLFRMSQIADNLSRNAWQIGLITLSSVAAHAANCARDQNRHAIVPVMARLNRVAAQSLRDIWGNQGPAA